MNEGMMSLWKMRSERDDEDEPPVLGPFGGNVPICKRK